MIDPTSLTWRHEPPFHAIEGTTVRVRTGENGDYWRETFYDFVHDDGHFLSASVDGDFTATAGVSGRYEALYDQGGLMIRIDEATWIKAGIEYADGAPNLSVVTTLGRSDWSQIRLDDAPETIELRLSRLGGAVRVDYRTGGGWRMVRLAPFPAGPARVGLMCCSPTRSGFEIEFTDFQIGAPIGRDLHA